MRASPPRSAAVPDNRWDLLDPATPEELIDPGGIVVDATGADEHGVEGRAAPPSVSIVIPCRDGHGALARTLATVAAQRYPSSRLEVVVADDGSDPPLAPEPPGEVALDVVRVPQPPAGQRRFGAGAARNAGAEQASGDVVLFCDADVLLDPWHVAAHARWHARSPDVVTMGPLRFVPTVPASPERIAQAAREDTLGELLEAQAAGEHEWIERHVARTDGLLRSRPDLFRIVVAADLGVGRALLEATGGFTSFGRRGIEDTEFGYRLWTAGGVLVRDPRARAWHQGQRTLTGAQRSQALAERAPLQAAWLPEGGFRTDGEGGHPRPRTVVEVGPGAPGDVTACVDAVLAQTDGDLAVCIPTPGEAALADDPRVVPGRGAAEAYPWSPLRFALPARARPVPDALARLRDRLDADALGALHVLLPATGEIAHLRRVRAWSRASRWLGEGASDDETDALAGELFGERWLDGATVGVVPEGVDPATPASPPRRPWGEVALAGARAASRVRRPDDVRKLWNAARKVLR